MTDSTNPPDAGNNGAAPIPPGAQTPNNVGGAPATPPPTYQMPPQQQYAPQPQPQPKVRTQGIGSAKKQKWPAVILAFTVGWLGIHKFYLGYKSEGLVMLLVALIGSICFGLGLTAMLVIGYIEAVKYVTLTEEDFEATYISNYKGWL